MAIDYDKLMRWSFPEVKYSFTKRDTILYALGLGLGIDPIDRNQLRFVYEDGLEALPTMATILGYSGPWLKNPGTGVDWSRALHGEQVLTAHCPPPTKGTVIGRNRVANIVDKDKGKAAILFLERSVLDAENGELLCTLSQTIVCRGEGGFGGPSGPASEPHPLPERDPDMACDLPTSPQAALIYRLSGDINPLHVDPVVANNAGFERPILHGLCTFGVAGHAILKTCCGYDPARLKLLRMRFSAPVFPGETIRTEIWRDGAAVSFRARVTERDAVVLNNGYAEIAD